MNLTLDEAWDKTLAMWTRIAEQWLAMNAAGEPYRSVAELKDAWMWSNHPHDEPASDCYFCEYDDEHMESDQDACDNCPARLVDPVFDCCNPDYPFDTDPPAFVAKIQELNRIRKDRL